MCLYPRRVYTVCGHVERLKEEKCDAANSPPGLSLFGWWSANKPAASSSPGLSLMSWWYASKPTATCREDTVRIEYGWCLRCETHYLPWNIRDVEVILNYWAHKNVMGYKEAVDPSWVPGDAIITSRRSLAANIMPDSSEYLTLKGAITAWGVPIPGQSPQRMRSHLMGILSATLHWAQRDGSLYRAPALAAPGPALVAPGPAPARIRAAQAPSDDKGAYDAKAHLKAWMLELTLAAEANPPMMTDGGEDEDREPPQINQEAYDILDGRVPEKAFETPKGRVPEQVIRLAAQYPVIAAMDDSFSPPGAAPRVEDGPSSSGHDHGYEITPPLPFRDPGGFANSKNWSPARSPSNSPPVSLAARRGVPGPPAVAIDSAPSTVWRAADTPVCLCSEMDRGQCRCKESQEADSGA